MIKNKDDYKRYLNADAIAMGLDPRSYKSLLKAYYANPRWKFIKKLRQAEYYLNVKKGPVYKCFYYLLFYRYKKYAMKLGFTIPLNVCGEGLSLPHYGTIVISKEARIGKNCRIHVCVNIGASGGKKEAPQIGNNVYIGPGAKLFGDIKIGNDNYIGANAVVSKTFDVNGVIIGGVPAKVLKEDNAVWWQKNSLLLEI
jgi:serine O-acetyltransferase